MIASQDSEIDQEASKMIQSDRWWFGGGVVAVVIIILLVGGLGWGYVQQIRQSDKSDIQIIQIGRDPEKSAVPAVEVRPVIAVWNGSGVAGAAGKLAAKLKEAGYEVVETKNAPKEQVGTTIEFSPEIENQVGKIVEIIGEGTDLPAQAGPARSLLVGEETYTVPNHYIY